MPAKRTSMTKKVQEFILDKVSDGNDVVAICDRMYKDELPHSKSVFRFARKNPEFREQLDAAYDTYLRIKHAEFEHVSTAPLDELFPNLEFKAQCEARRARMQALVYILGKLASQLSRSWHTTQKVEHLGEVKGPNIVIQSYSAPADTNEEKK